MTAAEQHRAGRPIAMQALDLADSTGAPLPWDTLGESQHWIVLAFCAVGWLETRYSKAWLGAGAGSFNWGADQSGRPPCGATGFLYKDTHPNPDGTSTAYEICFRRYTSSVLGARGLRRHLYERRSSVLAAARGGNFYGVSAELHKTRYYEGFGRTVAERIANHFKALSSAVRGMCGAHGIAVPHLGIPLPEPWQDDFLPDNPLIMKGTYGPYVGVWQRVANDWLDEQGAQALAVDNAFGRLTESTTKTFQRAHALKADGKVGPKTWGKAAELAA